MKLTQKFVSSNKNCKEYFGQSIGYFIIFLDHIQSADFYASKFSLKIRSLSVIYLLGNGIVINCVIRFVVWLFEEVRM